MPSDMRDPYSLSLQIVDGHGVVLHESTAKGVAEDSRDGSPSWFKVSVSAPLPKSLLSGVTDNFTLQARVQAKDAEHWAGHFGCDVALPSITFTGCSVDVPGLPVHGIGGHAADQSGSAASVQSPSSSKRLIDGGSESALKSLGSVLDHNAGDEQDAAGPTLGDALGSLVFSPGAHPGPASSAAGAPSRGSMPCMVGPPRRFIDLSSGG